MFTSIREIKKFQIDLGTLKQNFFFFLHLKINKYALKKIKNPHEMQEGIVISHRHSLPDIFKGFL